MDTFTTSSAEQTKKLGEMLARELKGGEIVCLTGELGSGKTTFAQGVLKGLGAKGPYTSPTFVVLKHYNKTKHQTPNTKITNQNSKIDIQNIYHIDCYRIKSQDILDLGWEEIAASKNNVVIVEWAERIKKIVPRGAVWVKFRHIKKSRRKITLSSKLKTKSAKPQLKTKI